MSDIPWHCPDCGREFKQKPARIVCRCGLYSVAGKPVHNSKTEGPRRLEKPAWRVPYWTRKRRYAACTACTDWNSDRCVKLELGCRRTFMRNLEDPLGTCPQGHWSPTELRLITCEQLALDSLRLAEKVPQDVSAVIGIPRSGMIPASIIASHLAVPLYAAVGGEEEVVELNGGRRTRGLRPGQGPLLLVDDSVGSGWQLSQFELLRKECQVAAVYVLPSSLDMVDYHAHLVDDPHLFEWNLWNGPGAALAALDLDGVMCADPPCTNDVAWEHTDAQIAALPPLYVPRNPQYQVSAIITGRTEHSRAATVAWLAAQRACYRELLMWPGEAGDRHPQDVARWKADQVKRIKATFYVESDPLLSEIMRRDHQVPVLCMREGVLR